MRIKCLVTTHLPITLAMKQPTPQSVELWNSRLALIGLVAAMGAYAVSGQVIPGIW